MFIKKLHPVTHSMFFPYSSNFTSESVFGSQIHLRSFALSPVSTATLFSKI